MYSMLIVDDEPSICQLIANTINWHEYDVNIIGIYNNAEEAYKNIMLYKPNIVLTDIIMPEMNGIELIKKVHLTTKRTKFIILSAYAEFNYAREAMKYNVKHYLIKPCNEEQLISAVQEACIDLVREKRISAAGLSKKKEPELSEFSPQVEEILQAIDENIANVDLTLKWIAETRVFGNVDHLSRKFHQETGHKFNEYLTSLRITKAKELMISNKNENIYTIADQVGYMNNPQYFSQVFKKATGMSPSEYMKKLR